MADHGPLGPASGARGIDQIGDIVGVEPGLLTHQGLGSAGCNVPQFRLHIEHHSARLAKGARPLG